MVQLLTTIFIIVAVQVVCTVLVLHSVKKKDKPTIAHTSTEETYQRISRLETPTRQRPKRWHLKAAVDLGNRRVGSRERS